MSVITANPLQCGGAVPASIWDAAELASWKVGPCEGEEPQQNSGACQPVCLPPASAFHYQGNLQLERELWGRATQVAQTRHPAHTPGTARTKRMCNRSRPMAAGCQVRSRAH